MSALHDKLNELKDQIVDAKTVIKVSEANVNKAYRKHIELTEHCEDKIEKITSKIDELVNDVELAKFELE